MATATTVHPIEPVIQLDLSPAEAEDLRTLLSHLGGLPDGTVRETLTDGRDNRPSVLEALESLDLGGPVVSRVRGLNLPVQ